MATSETPWLSERSVGEEPPDRAARGAAAQQTAYLHLLARLQSLLGKGPVPIVVIAGACHGPAAARIAGGLEQAARSSGLRAMVTELRGAPHPILALQPAPRRANGTRGEAPPPSEIVLADGSSEAALELHAGVLPARVEEWFAHLGGTLDLVLVAAPPLDSSLAGALLAKACDGLVIAVEESATPRRSLREAAQLARATGCRLLGLVLTGTHRRLPVWLDRFTASRRGERG